MPSKVYLERETEITFLNTGGSAVFTPASVASGAGRISARYDIGAAPRPRLFRWRAKTACQATPTVGRTIRIYLALWDDTTDADGDAGASDAAFATENKLRNLQFIGCIVVDVASTAAQKASSAGVIEINARYVSVVWWNDSGATLSATDANHAFTLIPVPDEIQDSA